MQENKIRFDEPTSIEEVIKYNKGIKPRYSKGTGKGDANCPNCIRCVCSLLYYKKQRVVVGWLYTKCDCGEKIDYFEAENYI